MHSTGNKMRAETHSLESLLNTCLSQLTHMPPHRVDRKNIPLTLKMRMHAEVPKKWLPAKRRLHASAGREKEQQAQRNVEKLQPKSEDTQPCCLRQACVLLRVGSSTLLCCKAHRLQRRCAAWAWASDARA